jgi:hypothetical protein
VVRFRNIARNLQEVEAGSVALICSESLLLPGIEYSRGYIQHWLAGESIPERSARPVFAAADCILKSGLATSKRPENTLASL